MRGKPALTSVVVVQRTVKQAPVVKLDITPRS